MKKILFILLLIGAAVFYFSSVNSLDTEIVQVDQPDTAPEQQKDPIDPAIALEQSLKTYTIEEGDTFATAVETFGIGYGDMLNIVSSSQYIYDFTSVRLGRDLRYRKKGEDVTHLEYDIDNDDKIVVKKTAAGYTAKKEPIPYTYKEAYGEGTILASLFVDGNKAGLSDALILDMAEILGWSIDFATAVQEGDSFKVAYKKRFRNGEEASHGEVYALAFTNMSKTHTATLFPDTEGNRRYYDPDGNSMVRQFLKAPLRYSRITSGFAYGRFHPVIGKNVPHLAIDYAAPRGTPILATADGSVTMSRYNGGFGNFIDIKLNGIYATQYAHLSAYAKGIRPGVRVAQGDVIGYVGSTGWSTGPHLHYQIKKYGQLVNPLTIELPAGDPVTEEERSEFERLKQDYTKKLK